MLARDIRAKNAYDNWGVKQGLRVTNTNTALFRKYLGPANTSQFFLKFEAHPGNCSKL